MQERRELLLLIVIMAAVAGIIGTSAIYIIYQGGIDRERARLQDIVQSQARMLESMARFDQVYSRYPEGAEAGSIRQFIEVHASVTRRGLGSTGEVTLARRSGDNIVYLLRQSRNHADAPTSIPLDSALAAPMREALLGRSGTMIATDYAGDPVLAAFEPVSVLDLGMVAKIDIAEIRGRFTRAALPLIAIGLVAVAAAAFLFLQITEPVLRRLRESESRFRNLFDHMKSGAAVFRAAPDGGEFIFTDLNRRGEHISRLSRREVIGKSVTEVFPGADEFGLLKGLKDAWTSGAAIDLPARYYRDGRIEGWRDSHIYTLPSGELVSLFDDVTEQKQAEQALKESEARFRGTFDNAAVGIAHVDFDGSWLRVNDRLCQIVGYDRDELLGHTFQEITHPDDLQSDLEQFGLLMRGEITSYSMEKRYLHKTGHIIWINLTTALQRDAAGRPLYCISVVEDISRRKHAEQTLHESEVRIRAVLDASEDEILLLSTEGRVLAINQAAERRLARRLADIAPVGARIEQLLPHDLAEARLATARDVAASGHPRHLDRPIRGRWFEIWFYPVRHAAQPVTEVAIFARDISDRKRAESELRRLYQAIQQTPSSIVITDPKGAIVYVNPKFCDLSGYAYEEVIGRNPRILRSGHTSPEEYKNLWQTIASGEIWQGEFCNRKKNGQLFWETASIAPVKNDEGRIINFVAVKEDVTERRAVEDQLRQSQKMQAIGQLTGGIAHDFNNLLTIIGGNLQLIERDLGEYASAAPLIKDAVWATQRGGELTHRLLAFARMQPLRPAEVNLNDIVRGMTELLRRTLGSGIEVIEALDPDIPSVLADTGELERALVNLAINARDAMPAGGRLTLQTRRATLDEDYVERYPDLAAGEYVMLAVSDSGTGIPKDMLDRIFEPFFTTKQAGQGSGLGLSMVYGFMKQSGGHISVYSEIGAGTTFKLFLPQRVRAAGIATETTAEGDSGFTLSGRIALVVEDELRLQKLATRLLDEVGFSVFAAGDGSEALRYAETEPRIDLLFTDVELPGGVNGIALAQRVQELHPTIKVLYTTGYSAALVENDGRVPLEASVLAKPYARPQLMQHLRRLFAPSRSAGGEGRDPARHLEQHGAAAANADRGTAHPQPPAVRSSSPPGK